METWAQHGTVAIYLALAAGCIFDPSGIAPYDATLEASPDVPLVVSDARDSHTPDVPAPDLSEPDADLCAPRTRQISFVTAKVAGGPHADFPLLVSCSGAYLRTKALGGGINHASGHDISFSADLAGSQRLDHEVELFDGTKGELVAWVRVPSLTSSTSLYMHYGDCTITSSQQNAHGVWTAGFKGVWHLNEAMTDESQAGKHQDSTSNNLTCAQDGNDDKAGMVAHGQDFDGDDTIGCGKNKIPNLTHHTITAWVKLDLSAAEGKVQGVVVDVETSDPWPGVALYVQQSNGAFGHFVSVWRLSKTNKVTSGKWTYLAIRGYRHPSAGYLDVSMDGSPWESLHTGSTTDLAIGASSPLRIGSYSGTAHHAQGVIDEVRIAGVARTASWIKTEYNNQSDPSAFHVVGPETP